MGEPVLIDSYDWSGGCEAMLRFGPETGPVVVVALPLFEEANRMRAFAVTLCRALAKRGVASVLPDLPGQGESSLATHDVALAQIRGGYASAVEQLYHEGRRAYSASIRSGAIAEVNAHCVGRWYLSPSSGQQLLAELGKILAAAGRDNDALKLRNSYQIDETAHSVEVAGNLIAPILLQDLTVDIATHPISSLGVPTRVLRLDTDHGDANRHVAGTPLWRRAEPGNDTALAKLLADDIADWIAACEG